MRILAIGDIHGKTIWKQALSAIEADIIVFVGDYVNLKTWSFTESLQNNLADLIRFKRDNFARVHLLLGNHDIPYLRPQLFSYSAIRKLVSRKLYELYNDNEDCFEIAFQYNKFLFSHAGVVEGWYKRHQEILDGQKGSTLSEKLNAVHHSSNFAILHERGKARGGKYMYGGITYADKTETEQNSREGYVQVVGHTKVPVPVKMNGLNRTMIYIDCLNSVAQFLYIDDDKITVRTLDGGSVPLGESNV
jgi:predicted phosphodiesterase